ncbi:MAG TPA: bifunctional UDP-N-acetylglucosamine diphosphorylase/glucosamine-1-phosphate N-acetyltransferase GlmU [Bryobacteraceae bacterium]|nr:bifunctional UDP-N-acetylglucosamine diphosphorylase/glucosamine-1-phosphate N-acetyltransferase GlmU [Bryobacteraceae bacterium]
MNVAILAAGLGTRMRSRRAKVLHRAGGLALVEHVIEAARAVAPPDRMVVVTGHQAEQVEEQLAPLGVRFARQQQQRGTGDALACCRDLLEREAGDLLMVLYGDTPLLSAATLLRLRDEQAKSDAAATLITTTLDDPSGYGRVLVDAGGNATMIVEDKACTPEQKRIRVINSGIYCFRSDLLWRYLSEIQPNPVSGEFYLTDMAAILTARGYRVRIMHLDDPRELLGINTRVELAEADRILRARKAEELMLSGVTIERPETVSIDARVRAGMDTVIEPFVRLLGDTEIGEDCRIGAGAILESSRLAAGAVVKPYTIISESTVESRAEIGPFARLRMSAHVGPEARIGNFVEVKKSRLGAGAKSQHLAYLGDARIGKGVNVGAGTITCNYDGEKKHETEIGDGAFIGSNSTLVAPVKIGAASYIGAGSVITDAVPGEALALGRGRQVVKEGWVAKKRARAGGPRSE